MSDPKIPNEARSDGLEASSYELRNWDRGKILEYLIIGLPVD